MSRKPPTKTDICFSSFVRKARKQRIDKSEFSSRTMAAVAGLSRESYSRKETNKSAWSLSEAIAVLKFLNIKTIEIEGL